MVHVGVNVLAKEVRIRADRRPPGGVLGVFSGLGPQPFPVIDEAEVALDSRARTDFLRQGPVCRQVTDLRDVVAQREVAKPHDGFRDR
ncbi:Uncharacterised protein [Mycobacteroides abscessus subsp. massiliense]|nr:Uncharacterised protein [Mycobacteroides abscessus subsp. massiliense]